MAPFTMMLLSPTSQLSLLSEELFDCGMTGNIFTIQTVPCGACFYKSLPLLHSTYGPPWSLSWSTAKRGIALINGVNGGLGFHFLGLNRLI